MIIQIKGAVAVRRSFNLLCQHFLHGFKHKLRFYLQSDVSILRAQHLLLEELK